MEGMNCPKCDHDAVESEYDFGRGLKYCTFCGAKFGDDWEEEEEE